METYSRLQLDTSSQSRCLPSLIHPMELEIECLRLELRRDEWPIGHEALREAMKQIDYCDVQNLRFPEQERRRHRSAGGQD